MMDFGYLGSSSNLSALAPPFTLDRTVPEPNSKPFLNFTDPPPAVPLSSSLPSWQYSNSSADFGVDSIRTTYLPSENYYPYLRSPTAQMPPLNANNVSKTPETYVFPYYSGALPTSYVESKTYCPSFVSPVTEDDVPLVDFHNPNYDLSSTSQVDYHQSLSGLKYTPQWGSYWDRIDSLADGEMGKHGDYDGFGSYTHKSYMKQGESQIATPSKFELNNKPIPTHGFVPTSPYDPARTLGISTPKLHANVPPVGAATTLLNNQKPYESQDQSFQLLNAGKRESITAKRSSPPVVIRPPPVGFGLRSDKKDHFSDSFLSNIRGNNVEEHMSKAEKELQLPDASAPTYNVTSASDRAKSVSSVEGPLESLDKYYPALDSPCWKGVSSSKFSPFEDQQTQFCTIFGEDGTKISSQKAHASSVYLENGYIELGSLLCPDRLPNASSPVKEDNSTRDNGVDFGKMSSSNLEPFSEKIDKLPKELESPNDSKNCSDLKHAQWKKPDFENNIELGFGVGEAVLNYNDASLKLDVHKLVETIHNLSKLLLFQCSDNTPVFSEADQELLNLAMKNLDACISKMVPNPRQESNLQKSVISGKPPLSKNHELPEKEVKKFNDLFIAKVEDFEKDNKVTQSIKKALEENFGAEEKLQTEALLYKNLWLEAEAALCFASSRARYDRMKTEIDEHKSPKKIAEAVKSFEELYDGVFAHPSNPIIEAFAHPSNPKMLYKSTQDPSASRTPEVVDEAETSFMARLDILKNRVPIQDSAYSGEQTDDEDDAAFAEKIKAVENLLSSDDAEDCTITNLSPKVKPHTIVSKAVDNVEASVMTRLQILKDRGANALSEKLGPVNLEFSGGQNPWRFNAVMYEDDIVDGPHSLDYKVLEHEMVKDFHVCASDDLASGGKRSGTGPSSGWYDGSLSDWEDVLKDEFAAQK